MSATKCRPSQYLVDRSAALRQALSYFSDTGVGPQERGTREKLLSFLAQIDWWHWEMESLIFAFDNFQQRSLAWGKSEKGIEALLSERGFMISRSVLDDLKDRIRDRVRHARWYGHITYEVYAPMEDLNVVIDLWNDLLDRCRKCVLMHLRHDPAELGMQVTDIGGFRFDRREA